MSDLVVPRVGLDILGKKNFLSWSKSRSRCFGRETTSCFGPGVGLDVLGKNQLAVFVMN
jgi:hypothetical protein